MIELFAPESYWKATAQQRAAACNGCGAKGFTSWLAPNTLYGLSIEEACNIHDWSYTIGETIDDKDSADRAFLNNMVRIIDAADSWQPIRALRRNRAMEYYSAVRDFGGVAFWRGKNRSEELGCNAGA